MMQNNQHVGVIVVAGVDFHASEVRDFSIYFQNYSPNVENGGDIAQMPRKNGPEQRPVNCGCVTSVKAHVHHIIRKKKLFSIYQNTINPAELSLEAQRGGFTGHVSERQRVKKAKNKRNKRRQTNMSI